MTRTLTATLLILTGLALGLRGQTASPQAEADPAAALFKAGNFGEAEKASLDALARNPQDAAALTRLGRLALYSNRLEDARRRLEQALALRPDDPGLKSLLAETFVRRDEFALAAPFARAAGDPAKADMLESFKSARPYEVESAASATTAKFVMTDPLPVVQVRVNGKDPVNFFIDTGGPVIILDPEFAKEVGAVEFGAQKGTFAGGKTASYLYGRVDSLAIGDFVVKHVPVNILDVRRFSQPVFGGTRVDGILGTVFLYHFLSTLDYPGGALILRLPTAENIRSFQAEAEARKAVSMSFWMAGDHFMVAWGSVNGSRPLLFLVDTGMAGGGFTAPESTLKAAGIKLDEGLAGQGIGGGGKMKVVPFKVDELALGAAEEKNIAGLFSGPLPFEDSFGFHIGGLISHAFFRPYALTFDFRAMTLTLDRRPD